MPLRFPALIAVAAALVFVPKTAPQTAPYNPADLAPTSVCKVGSSTQMLCLHNYTRKRHGLRVLVKMPGLYTSALMKAKDIESCEQFQHDPCGYGWDHYFPGGLNTWGENISYGYPTVRVAYENWLRSPGHYANIIKPAFRFYGSGYIAKGPYPRLWVVNFGG